MRRFVRNLGLMLILALPLEAGENSWSFTQRGTYSGLPHGLVFTGDPDVLYASSFSYLTRSDDGGRSWSHLEAPPGSGPLRVAPADPNVLLRFYYENLMRSTDGGKSWVPVLFLEDWSSTDVLFSRHFPGRVYAASKFALYQSRDGGATFSLRSQLPDPEIGNGGTLTEAADGGLYLHRSNSCSRHCVRSWRVDRSADQGATWVNLFLGQDGVDPIRHVLPHPTEPGVVYLNRSFGSSSRLLYSEDRGTSVVDRGEIASGLWLYTDASQPDSLLKADRQSLFRSSDRGLTWQEMPVPRSGIVEGSLVVGPSGRVIFSGSTQGPAPAERRAFVSEDAGASWSPLTVNNFLDFSVDEIVTSGPEGVLYLRTVESLYRSGDDGATWQAITSTIPRYLDHLTGDPADGNTFYMVGYEPQQPAALWRSRDGGQTYTNLVEIDPMYTLAAVRRGESTHLIAALRSGDLARSADGGDTWSFGPPVVLPAPANRVQFEELVVSGSSVYSQSWGILYGSEDGGATWTARGTGGDLLAAGGGVLAHVDRFTGTIGVSTTGGAPFTTYPLPFPADGNIYRRSSLVADQHGALYLLASSMVVRSLDRGRTWQALTQGLPELTESPKIVAHPVDANRLLWAEEAGLYSGTFGDRGILALLRGRFEARLRWRTSAQSEWSSGTAAVTSDQSGVFHLFSPERAEVAVQMLDGRSQGGRFWVFVASMTDVELELEILDRVEGEIWRHHQPLGEIRSTADLSAFPRQPQLSSGALTLPFGGLVGPQPVVTVNEKFDVSVSWIANGEINVAQGRKLLGDTAAFTFFDGSAVDVLVNIMDGRPINGKYWVFGGSLTDVQFVVTIKNRETGVIKTIHNPPGAFAGFSDSEAF